MSENDDKELGPTSTAGHVVKGAGTAVEYTGYGLRYPGKQLGSLGDGVLTEASLDESIAGKIVGYSYGGLIKTLGWAAEAPGMLTQIIGTGINATGKNMRSKPTPTEEAPPPAPEQSNPYMGSVTPEEMNALEAKLAAGNPDKKPATMPAPAKTTAEQQREQTESGSSLAV